MDTVTIQLPYLWLSFCGGMTFALACIGALGIWAYRNGKKKSGGK